MAVSIYNERMSVLCDDKSWRWQYRGVFSEHERRHPFELVLGHRACQSAPEPRTIFTSEIITTFVLC